MSLARYLPRSGSQQFVCIKSCTRFYSDRPRIRLDAFLDSTLNDLTRQKTKPTNHDIDALTAAAKQSNGFKPQIKRASLFRNDSKSSDDVPLQTSRRERAIFSTLMNSILEQKDKSGESLKSLFEVYDTSDDVELGEQRSNSATSLGKVSSKAHHAKPVVEHMLSLQSDQELFNYFTEKILSRSNELTKVAEPSTPVNVNAPVIDYETVPIYLERAISILIDSFDSPVAANTLFELSKRASLDFYAAAFTSAVFNRMITLKWKYYRDLYAVESLIAEMNVNAVKGDDGTAAAIAIVSSGFELLASDNVNTTRTDLARMRKLTKYRRDLINELKLERFNLKRI